MRLAFRELFAEEIIERGAFRADLSIEGSSQESMEK